MCEPANPPSQCQSLRNAISCASKLFDFSVVVAGDRPNGGARRDRTDDLMLAKHALSQLSYGPFEFSLRAAERRLVGPERVERSTSRLSGVRSNHLSYEPDALSKAREVQLARIQQIPRGSAARNFDRKEGKRGRRQDSPLCLSTDVWDSS